MTELTADERKRWALFRETVESLCTTEREKERIEAEFSLFEKRGWEKYILILSTVRKAFPETAPQAFEGGSACGSYALEKYIQESEEEDPDLLSGKSGPGILNGESRLDWTVIGPASCDEPRKGIGMLSCIIRRSGLQLENRHYAFYRTNPGENREKASCLIFSTDSVACPDVIRILNERRAGSKEVKEILDRYDSLKVSAIRVTEEEPA